jgi:alpha-galactosidase
MMFGDLDDCVNEMHEHVRRSVMMPQARRRGMWIESGIGPEEVMSQEAVLQHVDVATDIGAEVFFIDASWYSPPDETSRWFARVGDWEANADRYPIGIDGIRDYAHSKGLLFGLWMEPERFGVDSTVFAEHSDWCTRGYDGKIKGEVAGGGGMVDLAKPDAAAWVEDQMASLIERYKLEFFRLDFNATTASPFSWNERDGYLENSDWRYYEAFYAIMERLRSRFPDVIFEACASGGGRTDLGTARLFCHTWVTDWQLAPRSFAITNGMTMCLPPENVDRLLTGQDGFTTGSLDFQARLLLFVRPTIGSATQLGFAGNTVQTARIKHMMELYKSFVRPMMGTGRIYHHTPDVAGPEPKGVGVLELASRQRDRAIMGVFQLADPGEAEQRVCFRGIDSSGRYRVTLDNTGESFEVDGHELTMGGLVVRLGGALTSELLIVDKLG